MGSFSLGGGAGGPSEKRGPPPVVKKVLSLFGSGREEDKMVGYLSFLKIGPKLLKWVPGKKAADLRNWLTVYGYWNQVRAHLQGAPCGMIIACLLGDETRHVPGPVGVCAFPLACARMSSNNGA